MNYLAGWRMQVATQKLRNTNASLAQIADMVGYHSEAAFLRAFKKAGSPRQRGDVQIATRQTLKPAHSKA